MNSSFIRVEEDPLLYVLHFSGFVSGSDDLLSFLRFAYYAITLAEPYSGIALSDSQRKLPIFPEKISCTFSILFESKKKMVKFRKMICS